MRVCMCVEDTKRTLNRRSLSTEYTKPQVIETTFFREHITYQGGGNLCTNILVMEKNYAYLYILMGKKLTYTNIY